MNIAVDAERDLDKSTFIGIMGAFPTGVVVVTTVDETGAPRGLTSNAVSSVSAEPPLMLVCIDKRSSTLPALVASKKWVANYLIAGRGEISNLFASKDPDKFKNVSWRPGQNGTPVLADDTIAYVECTTVQELDCGDHIVLIGRATAGAAPTAGSEPLMYFRRNYATWPTA